ncbi:helicase HerA-like domain-containing protein [Oleiagrimonas sp. MCCC 1A03011]|uniref:helicase HerA-like domain-containing protein n=1 Tax=Oleiagrimonas sp. MCCC 1A03011 TaxID=1926883 RepID=UPI000DC5B402|nr:helicase HerA-like domain-containing protein [Oleiagrimonas sp. MCCC 1A03011]RAP59186.1 ATP-binding protein [Oleiagrimonas sp. MCCC 1A03011]
MDNILIGKNDDAAVELEPRFGNRHGMIAGATGTGKSVSLMVLAEGFSRRGVPVFLADVKGDLAGLSQPAPAPGEKLRARLDKLGLNGWSPSANPVVFWDLYARLGHPVRTTISEMGPTLLARVMELNDTQEGVLDVAFRVADDNGWLLLDLDDLRSLLKFAAEHASEISAQYGLISKASIGAIQRSLLQLEKDGAMQFFGEPALDLADLMRQDMSGRGVINILAADQLILKPRLYSTFLLWLLSELFEQLPEVGDAEAPKLVFFFDEAHLLFDECPPALLQRVEQVVRLIRSKGVGVYFCSQNPDDVPNDILGQLGNRVQHALRAFTPRDRKAIKAAAETFPVNPKVDVAEVITTLGVGEALATTLRDRGVPSPVEPVLVVAPVSRIGTITEDERRQVASRSPVGPKYDTPVNRDSAAEMLARRADEKAADEPEKAAKQTKAQAEEGGWGGALRDAMLGTGRRQGMLEAMGKSMLRSVGSGLGRQILRGVLGGILGGSRRS